MRECAAKKLIEEGNDPRAIRKVAEYRDQKRRTNAAVARAQRSGRYGDPDRAVKNWIEKDYSEMVGKTMTLYGYETNAEEDVKIRSIEQVGQDHVKVNGKVVVNTRTNMTSDGAHDVTMGSEPAVDEDVVQLKEYTGTLSEQIEAMFYDAQDLDGDNIDGTYTDDLIKVLETYTKVMEAAGKDVKLTGELMERVIKGGDAKGEADVTLGKIRLVVGDTRRRKHTEVLAHELQHILIGNAIKDNQGLERDINRLKDEVAKDLDYKVFLQGLGTKIGDRDGYAKADIDWAKETYSYVFENEHYPAEEFLAFATTNQQLMNAMKMQREPVKQGWVPNMTGTGKFATRMNRIIDRINKAIDKLLSKGTESKQELAVQMMNKALELQAKVDQKADKTIGEQVGTWIGKYDDKVASITGDIEKEQVSLKEALIKSNRKKPWNAVMDKIWNIRGMSNVRSMILRNNIFSSLTRESDNEDVMKFYDMFRQSKKLVDTTVQQIKNATADALLTEYGFEKLSMAERKAMKRVLVDTDAKILTLDEVKEFIGNSGKIDSEIAKIEKEEELGEKSVKAAQELGVMISGNDSYVKNVYTNATEIALEVEGDGSKVKALDRIATLTALGLMADGDVELTKQAMESNPEGVEHAMELLRTYEKTLVDKGYGGDARYITKGGKQEHFVGDKTYYLASKGEMEEMVKAGMVNVGIHEELSQMMEEPRYIVIGENLDSGYTEGLMSIVQLKNEGESLRGILAKSGKYSEEEIDEIIDSHANMGNLEGSNGYMIPERAAGGNIYDYRVRMSHDVKEKYLGLDNDMVLTLAHTAANVTHKDEAMMTNKANLRYMVKFYNKYKDNSEMKFVEISEEAEGRYGEYWDLMPMYLKNELRKLSSDGKMYVEESMLVNYFGYKDATLMNAPWIKDKVKRQMVASKIEKIVKEITKEWKRVIVTMTGGTIYGNTTSNMAITLQHVKDKSPTTYLKNFGGLWQSLNDYQKLTKEMNKLVVKRDAGEENLDRKIEELKTRLSRNRVHVMMEDGQYNVILEDIDTGLDGEDGIIAGKINDLLEKVKKEDRRATIKDVMGVLYLTKDSGMYQKMLKLTLYMDIINRVIIHEDHMRSGEMSERDSLRYVDRLFVNYAYLDNKYIKYANDVDLLQFTKYFFRSIPAMLRMAARKPVTMFMTEAGQGITGVDIETPVDQYLNPWDTFTNKIWHMGNNPVNMLETLVMPRTLAIVN